MPLSNQELIERYQGTPVVIDGHGPYQEFALSYFHDSNEIMDPMLSLTMDFDLTEADQNYRRHFAQVDGATFTAYLYWRLLQTLKAHPMWAYRRLAGAWYHFHNLPLFFPMATGTRNTYANLLLENVVDSTWEAFVQRYAAAIAAVKAEPERDFPVDPHTYTIAWFFGNLPGLRFTAMELHRPKAWTARPVFYFGRRDHGENGIHCPLHVAMDHGNADPHRLEGLLADYSQLLKSDV